MGTAGFKKNLRGAQTYAMPATPDYRDNYDRIFRPRHAGACEHEWVAKAPAKDGGWSCKRCGVTRVDETDGC